MTIHERINKLEKHVDKEFTKMKTYVDNKIAPLHDHLVAQEAIKKSRSDRNISVSRDIIKIITILALVIAALVGVGSI